MYTPGSMLLLLLLLLLLPLLLLFMLLPNMLFNAITFDSTSEHNFHFHHVRLKPPSMTLSSATFYSTPARSTLHNIYMLYYYSTNSLSHSPIASNYEKRSYCSCCIIGDFFSHDDVLAIAGCRVNVHCRDDYIL